jgi:hypothetical protein
MVGCSNAPAPITPPDIDGRAAEAAIDAYDQNRDRAIDGTEMAKSPGLKSALARLDANHDGKLAADEIDARLSKWRDSQLGLMRLAVIVRLDGQPLRGAQVALAPEKFLGPAVKRASGTTNEQGMVQLRIADDPDAAGVHPGFYLIEISKKEGNRELIPSRYNAQSELGLEIASDNTSLLGMSLDLRSR